MPKTVYIGPSGGRSGISIDWTKTKQRLDFGAWYDSFVGIEGKSFTLAEFFKELGITKKDCDRVWGRQK